MAETPKRGGIQKKAPPAKPKPAPLTSLQRAERALSTQGWPTTLAGALTSEEQAALGATLDNHELATQETVTIVERVVREYHARMKAVVDKPAPATPTIVDSPVS